MERFREFDVVRVRVLRVASRHVDGSAGAIRAPQVGDVGTIVHVLAPDRFVVESVRDDGSTAWLADFDAEELERASRS